MGTWSTSIKDNDIYADVYSDFFERYNEGMEVDKISKILINENQEIIDDYEDNHNFWFALAMAQWECKQLDIDVYQRVKTIIESNADIELWQEMDADEQDLIKRKIALDKFWIKLQSERPKAKARKKKRLTLPFYQKGDCITFKHINGNYGGAVILEAKEDYDNLGLNLVAVTSINQSEKPTIKDFETAKVLMRTYEKNHSEPQIKWHYKFDFKKHRELFETVGSIDIKMIYNDKKYRSYVLDAIIHIIESCDNQFKMDKNQQAPIMALTIKQLIDKPI